MSEYGLHRQIPNTYENIPSDAEGVEGLVSDWASDVEVRANGFFGGPEDAAAPDKPGEHPLSEYLVHGETVDLDGRTAARLVRDSKVRVLRNPLRVIVATWDEGRWWTAEESEVFIRQLAAEYEDES